MLYRKAVSPTALVVCKCANTICKTNGNLCKTGKYPTTQELWHMYLSFTDCMHLTDNPLHFKKGLGNVQIGQRAEITCRNGNVQKRAEKIESKAK